MREEEIHLSKEEGRYCLYIGHLAAKACRGSDMESKAEALCLRLEAELGKAEELGVSLSAEEKNSLSMAVMMFELLAREKYGVAKDHFHMESIAMTEEEIRAAADEIRGFAKEQGLDTASLQKKIRYRRKTPARKLYIADLHFFHDNLNRLMDRRGFSGFEEMNDHMIRQWNGHVTEKDEVYILGDFCISRGRAANTILQQLKGKKYLIEGNHDKFLEDKAFDRSLFEWIRPYAEIQDNKRLVILSHYPVFCYKGQYRTDPEGRPMTYMLYGHVHNTHDERLVDEFIRITRNTMVKTRVTSKNREGVRPIPCQMINCFCMFSDYIPLTLDDWIRQDAERRKVKKNSFESIFP